MGADKSEPLTMAETRIVRSWFLEEENLLQEQLHAGETKYWQRPAVAG